MIILDYLWAIWLGVFVIALIIEGMSSELVSVWFAFGSLIALIVSLIPGVAWWVQLIVFTVVSVATLLALRPILMKFMNRHQVQSNVDSLIHKKGEMTKACDQFNHGEVKVSGVIWTAVSQDESTPISAGSVVEVAAIDGNKLIVKEIKKGA